MCLNIHIEDYLLLNDKTNVCEPALIYLCMTELENTELEYVCKYMFIYGHTYERARKGMIMNLYK